MSRPLAYMVIGLFLAVQLALPIERLGQEGDRRFGWQMYSDTDSQPEFEVTTPQGTAVVDLNDYLSVVRVDFDLTSHLPPHLCGTVPGAESVSWGGGSYQC